MNNALSFIPIGIALCYCYLTLRETNKTEIKPWYELDSMESLAIIYCIIIASIRTNWDFFVSILKIGMIVVLVALGWYLLYNIEEFKNMIIFIMRKNSIEGESNHETDFENAITDDFVPETENHLEKEIPADEIIDAETEIEVDESFSEIDKKLDILIPQIDKFIENFNADTKKYIEYVEQEREIDATETSKPAHQFSSERLVSELERITDSLVRDTRKIADNVVLVSSMIVENTTTESLTNYEYANPATTVTPANSKTTIGNENMAMNSETKNATMNSDTINIEMNSEKLIPETKTVQDIVSVPLDTNDSSDHQEKEIKEEEQLICNTENIAESMVTAISTFVETLNP